ncbi:MAG: dihydrofolate reductase family protein [Liquorilactobacillus sp.]|jgi:dihydrofolate reductase|uniref:dihydrofolate reductase family protein n=1 Tax=Liquorilactobacillus nagelii TaxID=82688 RepID=UPI0039EB7001
MRKVILSIAMSLDGFIAKPDGNVDWLRNVPNPEKIDYGFSEFYKTIDTTLMGNNTYKEILGFGIPFPFPDKKNYVFSRSKQTDTESVQFITNEIPSFVQELKRQNGSDIWLIGGGQINTEFLNNGLIDELLIRIVPIVIGEGLPLFAEKPTETIFKVVKTETFNTGVIQITYHLL